MRGDFAVDARPEPSRTDVFMIGVLGLALLACGGGLSKKLEEPTSQDASFVYGHFDMSDAPTGLDWVEIKQVAPPSETPYYSMRVDDGAFYVETLPPGSFIVYAFGQNGGFLKTATTYNLSHQGNPVRLVIKQPGIYYLGSWKVSEVDTGFFEADKFAIEPLPTPTAREVLERILKHSEGTWWEKTLREHVQTLR